MQASTAYQLSSLQVSLVRVSLSPLAAAGAEWGRSPPLGVEDFPMASSMLAPCPPPAGSPCIHFRAPLRAKYLLPSYCKLMLPVRSLLKSPIFLLSVSKMSGGGLATYFKKLVVSLQCQVARFKTQEAACISTYYFRGGPFQCHYRSNRVSHDKVNN